MFKKLLFRNFTESDLENQIWLDISKISHEVVLASENSQEYSDSLSEADGLLIKLGSDVDSKLFDQMPRVKYIGMLGTGYGNVDINEANKRNCTVCNIADYATTSVSEFVFGVLLSHIRELHRATDQALEKNYSEDGFDGSELKSKTLGIIGLGDIGLEVAKVASLGFGMNVQYWSRNRKQSQESNNIKYVEINELLENSDIISIHLALTDETTSFIDDKAFNQMKDNVIIINTAPIEIINFNSLIKELNKNNKHLIMDHADEMSGSNASILVDSKNCTVYPPIGYTSQEASILKQKHFIKSMISFLKNKPFNQVNSVGK